MLDATRGEPCKAAIWKAIQIIFSGKLSAQKTDSFFCGFSQSLEEK
jgi:hypothetical protein